MGVYVWFQVNKIYKSKLSLSVCVIKPETWGEYDVSAVERGASQSWYKQYSEREGKYILLFI